MRRKPSENQPLPFYRVAVRISLTDYRDTVKRGHDVGRIGDSGTQDIFDGKPSKSARHLLPVDLWATAQRKLDLVLAASVLGALSSPPNNHLKKLAGDLKGQWSIRINDQYRIVFRWSDELRAHDVRICDYH